VRPDLCEAIFSAPNGPSPRRIDAEPVSANGSDSTCPKMIEHENRPSTTAVARVKSPSARSASMMISARATVPATLPWLKSSC